MLDDDGPIPERDMAQPRKEFWISPQEMDDLMRVISAAKAVLLAWSDGDDFGPELRALEAAVEQHQDPVDLEELS